MEGKKRERGERGKKRRRADGKGKWQGEEFYMLEGRKERLERRKEGLEDERWKEVRKDGRKGSYHFIQNKLINMKTSVHN